ncbi:hypothetical protein AB6A40_011647 [Gnathostoma spinigerum]|uniref:Uncharacterized protein n=1 Tax=Gnathostoma spinigerum TaxID=75299 RepID=A0ABD6EY87_9BILA
MYAVIGAPGGYSEELVDFSIYLWLLEKGSRQKTVNDSVASNSISHYISRYQSWEYHNHPCKGYMSSHSCVYGANDVKNILKQPHIIAHKFELNFEAEAYYCLYKSVRERALDDIRKFNDKPYGDTIGKRFARYLTKKKQTSTQNS